jgi:SAM-dependent MidA family methyltransferase
VSTPLADILCRRIAANGPITLADYMAECLLHPEHGYYATRDPFGASGDFITAPETSQMFGEMIGLALAQAWMDQGCPDDVILAELGPGRGTLMADILRATKSVPQFYDRISVHLVEVSVTLRNEQRHTLNGHDVTWHDTVSDLPAGPLLLVANEFFDALPIRQFQRGETGWSERLITCDDAGRLAFGLSPETAFGALGHRLSDTRPGDIVETCPAAGAISAVIGQRIADHGGAALFIDYGDWHSLGDTFQAMKAQKYCDPLQEPGEADLTAHVDFEVLAQASPAAFTRLTPQGVFLERLGITHRAQSLAKGMSGPDLKQHIAAHRRLTHPEEMGNLFKVLGLYPKGAVPPPGLEP